MRVAIPVWRNRVSPVFDVAGRLVLVDLADGAEVQRSETCMDEPDTPARARKLAELGVDVLICGAITQPLEAMLAHSGVRVISQTCGGVDDVLRAFQSGRLADRAFAMPGCRGRRRGACHGHRRGRNSRPAQEDIG